MADEAPDTPVRESDIDGRLASIVETLVNQIAHDVRNYAFTVGLQAELGERRSEAMPEVKGHFSAVLRQVDSLKSYLERLLLFGRPAVLRPIVADAGAIVRQQVQALQFSWRPDAPPLSISVEIAADIGEVRWDTTAIGHALQAVLDNAVRSADPSPLVTVRASRPGDRVVIEVADRGTGIPENTRQLIWLPMRVRRHGGSGLGLAIARKMVNAHGGVIGLESTSDGTSVRIELPVESVAV